MLSRIDRRAIPASAVEGRFACAGGQEVRRIDWPGAASGSGPRGSLLFLPGRGDFYEKYLETLDGWHASGWRVAALDWRGQAGSGRLSPDSAIGHVEDFAAWIADLAGFWKAWRSETPGPHVIVGHSMGGHLVLRALAERAVDPVAAVLSAPMLGLHAPVPAVLAHTAARLMCRIGDPGRAAWSNGEKPGAAATARHHLLTHDEDRYADEQWWKRARPELAMGPGSWRWVERACASIRLLESPGMLEAVRVPVLLLPARHDRLVTYAPIARAARRLPNGELVVFGREARHELLREADPVRDAVLARIEDFLDRRAPSPQGCRP